MSRISLNHILVFTDLVRCILIDYFHVNIMENVILLTINIVQDTYTKKIKEGGRREKRIARRGWRGGRIGRRGNRVANQSNRGRQEVSDYLRGG